MTARKLLYLVVITVTSLSCGGGGDSGTGPVPPDPGPVDVLLTTPNSSDGALLLSITGGAITSVQAQGFELAASPPGTSVKVLVRGNLTTGAIATVTVPDRNKLSNYNVTVLQAAARGTYVQSPTTGYAVTLRRP